MWQNSSPLQKIGCCFGNFCGRRRDWNSKRMQKATDAEMCHKWIASWWQILISHALRWMMADGSCMHARAECVALPWRHKQKAVRWAESHKWQSEQISSRAWQLSWLCQCLEMELSGESIVTMCWTASSLKCQSICPAGLTTSKVMDQMPHKIHLMC